MKNRQRQTDEGGDNNRLMVIMIGWRSKLFFLISFRETFDFFGSRLDLYWTFEEMLGAPSVWFGFLLLSALALIPDVVLMTLGRYFYRTKTQLAQVWLFRYIIIILSFELWNRVSLQIKKCLCSWLHSAWRLSITTILSRTLLSLRIW